MYLVTVQMSSHEFDQVYGDTAAVVMSTSNKPELENKEEH